MIARMSTVSETTESQLAIDEIRDLVNDHLEKNEETIRDFADRSGVSADFLYRFLRNQYSSSPSFDCVCKLAAAIGRKITLRKK